MALRMMLSIAMLLGFATLTIAAPYAEGQVWEHCTRPGEEGSVIDMAGRATDSGSPPRLQ